MTAMACVCENDHGFTSGQAARLKYVCNKCGSPIACTPASPGTSPENAPDIPEEAGSKGP